jgi:hypothetical protein
MPAHNFGCVWCATQPGLLNTMGFLGILGFAAFGQRDCPFVIALQQQLSFDKKI